MPVLDNAHHEAFAQQVARGMSQREAYRESGLGAESKDEVVDSCASRLLSTDKVSARVDELKSRAAARTEREIARVYEELARIGTADIRKAVQWGEATPLTDPETGETKSVQSIVLVPSNELDDATAACISEISEGKDGSKRIKFHNKIAALQEMGRHLGVAQKVEHTGKDGAPLTPPPSDMDLARWIAFTLTTAAMAKPDEPPGK